MDNTFSDRSMATTLRTYARPDEESGKLETWSEVVERSFVRHHQKLAELNGFEISEEEISELRQLGLNRQSAVSGRTLWLGGTEYGLGRACCNFNCFGRETSFITNAGVRTFQDCENGEKVTVWSHKGRWCPATVRCYNKQQLYRIELRRGSSVQTLRATKNHTWVLANGNRTTALAVGNRLHSPSTIFNSWNFDEASPFEQLYWTYGFVYGDGTLARSGNSVSSMVRLCGAKGQYLPRFETMGFPSSRPLSCKGEPFAYTGKYLKTLPDISQDGVDLVRAFVRGYLDADGAKASKKSPSLYHSIQVTGSEAINFVRNIFPTVGVFITREEAITKDSNYGPRSDETIRFGISTSFGTSANVCCYSVAAIEEDVVEDVWCLEVEEDHSFTLPNGIVTGNCSALQISNVFDLVDATWLLLNGSGVGFKPSVGTLRGFDRPVEVVIIPTSQGPDWKGHPENREHFETTHGHRVRHITVGDSAEAWAKLMGKLFVHEQPYDTLIVDGSNVRGGGKRIKGYGWICNGFEPLGKAVWQICQLLNENIDQLLDEIAILDVVNLIGTILSSRRSAQIAFLDSFSPRRQEFSWAKFEYWKEHEWRRQSNNTIHFWHKPSRGEIQELLEHADHCGGDPGISNAAAMMQKMPWAKISNPCLTGNTLVAVPGHGLKRIEELAEGTWPVIDGNKEVTSGLFRMTSESASIVEVELSNGAILEATEQHNFVLSSGEKKQVMDLQPGDELTVADIVGHFGKTHKPVEAYVDAWMIADGTRSHNMGSSKLYIYPPKEDHIPALEAAGLSFKKDGKTRHVAYRNRIPCPPKDRVPDYVLQGDKDTVLAFILGAIESDGTIVSTSKGWLIQFTSVKRSFLQDLQALLRLIGARGKIATVAEAGERMLPDGRGGSRLYYCQKAYRLAVSNPMSIMRYLFPDLVKRGPYQKEERVFVAEVRYTDRSEPVYCANVPTTHSFALPWVVSGNCHEIGLANMGVCNLVTNVLPRFRRNFSKLCRAVRMIARANYRQSCVDMRDNILQPGWHQTNDSLHLCGVSLTGICQADWLTDYQIRMLRNEAIFGAYSQADEWGKPRPKAVTTVKPEGTFSKCSGSRSWGEVTEGVNRPLGQYILNWINFSTHDPVVEVLNAAGYKTLPNPSDPTNVLACFPVEYQGVHFDKVNGKQVNLEPAISQLNRYLRWNNLWADHMVSCTISYSPDEIPAMAQWVDEHWDRGFIACAFLRRADPTKTARDLGHPYLPQEVVTEETYRTYKDTLRAPDWSKVTGMFDVGDLQACESGVCPVR